MGPGLGPGLGPVDPMGPGPFGGPKMVNKSGHKVGQKIDIIVKLKVRCGKENRPHWLRAPSPLWGSSRRPSPPEHIISHKTELKYNKGFCETDIRLTKDLSGYGSAPGSPV